MIEGHRPVRQLLSQRHHKRLSSPSRHQQQQINLPTEHQRIRLSLSPLLNQSGTERTVDAGLELLTAYFAG